MKRTRGSRDPKYKKDGKIINVAERYMLDDSEDKAKAAALRKSPDHTKMQMVEVPEIKEGTFICIPRGENAEKARLAYLEKHNRVKIRED